MINYINQSILIFKTRGSLSAGPSSQPTDPADWCLTARRGRNPLAMRGGTRIVTCRWRLRQLGGLLPPYAHALGGHRRHAGLLVMIAVLYGDRLWCLLKLLRLRLGSHLRSVWLLLQQLGRLRLLRLGRLRLQGVWNVVI